MQNSKVQTGYKDKSHEAASWGSGCDWKVLAQMLKLMAQRVGELACIRRCMAALLLQHLQVCPAFMRSMLVSEMSGQHKLHGDGKMCQQNEFTICCGTGWPAAVNQPHAYACANAQDVCLQMRAHLQLKVYSATQPYQREHCNRKADTCAVGSHC